MAPAVFDVLALVVALALGALGTYLGYRAEMRARRERQRMMDREETRAIEYLIRVLETGSQINIRTPGDITADLKQIVANRANLGDLVERTKDPPEYVLALAKREEREIDLARIHRFADILHVISLTREVPLPDDDYALEFETARGDKESPEVPKVDPVYQENRTILVLTSLFHQLYLALEKVARETKGLVEHNHRLFWKVVEMSDEFSKSYSSFFARCGKLVIEQDQLLRKYIRSLSGQSSRSE